MADAKITLDADTAAMVAKLTKAGDAVKKAGKDAADGFGNAMGDALQRSLLKVEALKKAIRIVAQAADEVGRKAIDASRAVGGRAVSLATSLAPLGIQDLPKFSRQLEDAKGLATTEERVSFAQALSQQSESSPVPLDAETAKKALLEFARGGELYYGRGGSELLKGLQHGASIDDIRSEAVRRRPGLSDYGSFYDDPLTEELRVRSEEDRLGNATARDRAFNRGFRYREGRASAEARASDSLSAELTLAGADSAGAGTYIESKKGDQAIGSFEDALQTNSRILGQIRGLNVTGQGEAGH